MSKTIIGIDNGVTGTVAILYGDNSDPAVFQKMPVFSQQSYTKTKQNITRINFEKLNEILSQFKTDNVFCVLERPMINPTRWKASMSAMRCLEATLICLELNKIPYQYCDSKLWQKEMLPKGLIGTELKSASQDIAIRLFPQFEDLLRKHGDGDSLLMAEYARRKGL